jgi:hypothetical protein
VRYERRRMRDWVLDSGAVQMNFEKCSFLTKFQELLVTRPIKKLKWMPFAHFTSVFDEQ